MEDGHHHPSESIPNAAYPDDSTYQPGQGHLRPNNRPIPSANSFSSSGAAGGGIASPRAVYQSSSSGRSHSYTDGGSGSTAWDGQGGLLSTAPSSPPPPYDPNNVPARFGGTSQGSIAGHRSGGDHQRGRAENEGAEAGSIPLQTLAPARPPPSRIPSRSDISRTTTNAGILTTTTASSREEEEAQSGGPSALEESRRQESYNKLGPVEAARRRKKRRAKICLILLSLVVVFLLALVLGIALSVLKARAHARHEQEKQQQQQQQQQQGNGDPYG